MTRSILLLPIVTAWKTHTWHPKTPPGTPSENKLLGANATSSNWEAEPWTAGNRFHKIRRLRKFEVIFSTHPNSPSLFPSLSPPFPSSLSRREPELPGDSGEPGGDSGREAGKRKPASAAPPRPAPSERPESWSTRPDHRFPTRAHRPRYTHLHESGELPARWEFEPRRRRVPGRALSAAWQWPLFPAGGGLRREEVPAPTASAVPLPTPCSPVAAFTAPTTYSAAFRQLEHIAMAPPREPEASCAP